MTPLQAELQQIVAGVRILGSDAFILGGQHFPVEPTPPTPADIPPLVTALQLQLYQYAYCRRYREPLTPPPTMLSQADLTATLAQANTSRDRWSGGWQVLQLLPTGQIAVQRYGQVRQLWPGEFISLDGPGIPPRPGAVVNRYHPRDSATMQPGFYYIFGETEAPNEQVGEVVRFYWNLRAGGAASWVQLLTTRLNFYKIPFRAKCITHPALFYRRDPALIYTAAAYARIVAEISAEVYPHLKPHLEPDVPLFTRQLAPGIGFAEEPGEANDSFGTHRCRLLALGLVQAAQQEATPLEAQMACVQHQFEQTGLHWHTPHLRAGAVDHYEFPFFEAA